jgi:hypothetical protein
MGECYILFDLASLDICQTQSLVNHNHCVTGARDSISRTSLFETFLMMFRSISDLSL